MTGLVRANTGSVGVATTPNAALPLVSSCVKAVALFEIPRDFLVCQANTVFSYLL
jgi:hypothetical protein